MIVWFPLQLHVNQFGFCIFIVLTQLKKIASERVHNYALQDEGVVAADNHTVALFISRTGLALGAPVCINRIIWMKWTRFTARRMSGGEYESVS